MQREPNRKRVRSGLRGSARCYSQSPARRIKRPPLSPPRARVAVIGRRVNKGIGALTNVRTCGGSLEQGGMDELMPPAPPLDADTPLDAALRDP